MSVSPTSPSPKTQAPPRQDGAHGNGTQGDLDSAARTIGATVIAAKGLDMAIKAADNQDMAPPLTASAKATGDEGRTPGERRFNISTYKLTAIGTFILSAAALYLLKYSKTPVWFGLTGSEKTMKQAWSDASESMAAWGLRHTGPGTFADKINLFGWKPLTFTTKEAAGNLLETSATFLGGNIMLGVILPREHHKAEIVHRLNEKHGTKEDVERGDRRVARTPKQNWGSIVGGRLVAFAVVFSALRGGSKLIQWIGSQFAQPGETGTAAAEAAEKGLKAYEHWAGRRVQEAGTAIAPNAAFTQDQGWDKIGRSVAVDVFATAAAVGILETSSRAIAKFRDRKLNLNDREPVARNPAKPSAPQPRAASYAEQAKQEKQELAQSEAVRG